jgi:hypothetical protein
MGERGTSRADEAGLDDACDDDAYENATAVVEPDQMRELLAGMASDERATREVDPEEFRRLLRTDQILAEGTGGPIEDPPTIEPALFGSAPESVEVEREAASESVEPVGQDAPRRSWLDWVILAEIIAIAIVIAWLVVHAF